MVFPSIEKQSVLQRALVKDIISQDKSTTLAHERGNKRKIPSNVQLSLSEDPHQPAYVQSFQSSKMLLQHQK